MNVLDRLAEVRAAQDAVAGVLPRVGPLAYSMVHTEVARRTAVASLRISEEHR